MDARELENKMKDEIKHQKEHELEHVYEENCLEKAASNMKIEMADELVEDEVEHMYKDFMQRMAMQGITEEMYYQYTKGKKEDITSQMKDDATKRIKYRYLLKEVIKVEKIKVSDNKNEALVVFSCNTMNGELATTRYSKMTVITEKHTGIRISNKAIRVVDGKTGVYMGIFNFFITIPQIINALFSGLVLKHVFGLEAIWMMVLSGAFLLIGAVTVMFIKEK